MFRICTQCGNHSRPCVYPICALGKDACKLIIHQGNLASTVTQLLMPPSIHDYFKSRFWNYDDNDDINIEIIKFIGFDIILRFIDFHVDVERRKDYLMKKLLGYMGPNFSRFFTKHISEKGRQMISRQSPPLSPRPSRQQSPPRPEIPSRSIGDRKFRLDSHAKRDRQYIDRPFKGNPTKNNPEGGRSTLKQRIDLSKKDSPSLKDDPKIPESSSFGQLLPVRLVSVDESHQPSVVVPNLDRSAILDAGGIRMVEKSLGTKSPTHIHKLEKRNEDDRSMVNPTERSRSKEDRVYDDMVISGNNITTDIEELRRQALYQTLNGPGMCILRDPSTIKSIRFPSVSVESMTPIGALTIPEAKVADNCLPGVSSISPRSAPAPEFIKLG